MNTNFVVSFLKCFEERIEVVEHQANELVKQSKQKQDGQNVEKNAEHKVLSKFARLKRFWTMTSAQGKKTVQVGLYSLNR